MARVHLRTGGSWDEDDPGGRHRTERRVAARLADDVDDVRLEVPQDRESAGRLPVDVERIDAVRLNPGVGTIPCNASGSEGGLRREAHAGGGKRWETSRDPWRLPSSTW